MNISFYFTCLRSGGVCLAHHLLAPRMERTDWDNCLFGLPRFVQLPHGLKQCLINIRQHWLSPVRHDIEPNHQHFRNRLAPFLYAPKIVENVCHYILLNHSESVKCIMCIRAHCTLSLSQHGIRTPEHTAGGMSLWERHTEILLAVPPVCPLNVVTSVQLSCSSLRMVTWPDWSPINTCRVSTSNLSCKH